MLASRALRRLDFSGIVLRAKAHQRLADSLQNSKRNKATMTSQDDTAAATAALAATALDNASASAPAAAPDAPAPDGPSSSSEEQKVDPWNVSAGKDGKVDYEKLSRDVS